MLKIFRYVKEKWYFIIIIFVLLFSQAMSDLALPEYTSKIVNVGIQQKGVEDAVPEEIREEAMNQLFLLMDMEERSFVEDSYTLKSGIYHLKKIGNEEREKLNEAFGVPMFILYSLSDDREGTQEMKSQMGIPEGMDFGVMLSQMPEEQLVQVQEKIKIAIAEMDDFLVAQVAVMYIQEEYVVMGRDVGKIQNTYVLVSGLKMLGVALVSMACAVLTTLVSCKLAASLGHNLRNKVYKKVLSFSGKEMNQFSTASLITRSTNDIQQVQTLITMLFRIIIYAPILGIGGIIKVMQSDTSMTWILALGIGLLLMLVVFLFTVAMPKFKRMQTLLDKLNLVTREILTGITVIRAFSNQKREEERFEDANQILTKTTLFVNRCMSFMMPMMMLIMNGITVLIIYNGARSIDGGMMQVGDMLAFIQYAMQIIMAFLMLTMISIMLPRASVSAKRINEILDTEISIEDISNPVIPNTAIKGSVEFKNVSFQYPNAEEKVLDNISFTAKKGETIAFIGSTGSGKSTLINLIPRIFDSTEGEILVDGTNIKHMSLKDLRARIGYVPQKGVLFSGSIDSNIRYGNEEASEDEVKQAAKVAQAWDFISEKEEGLKSPISQGGSNVSGGQKQRLSIARAVAKNPEIFIFDDSFSALDYKTDVVLRRALKNETKEATTLIVAQRISTILHADNIIVIDEGKMVGQGPHKELLNTCEVYKQIAMSQLSEEELANE
jgi:ABC-type multidrug transport system, ATPase and permease components